MKKEIFQITAIAGIVIVAITVIVFFVPRDMDQSTDGGVVTTPETEGSAVSRWWDEYLTPRVVVQPDPSAYPKHPVVSEASSVPFFITSDVNLLQGEGFFYAEDGVLYRTKLENGVALMRGQKVAEGVESVATVPMIQNEKVALFTKRAGKKDSFWDNEVWGIDKETGMVKKIAEDVYSAQFSPKGDMILVSTYDTHEVRLVDTEGNLLNKIGVHGARAAFSPDSGKIAYHKLPDNPPAGATFGELLENALGVAVYDIATGKESLVLENPDVNRYGPTDFEPLGFSKDNTFVYFISNYKGGGSIRSVWSLKLDGRSEPTRLTDSSVVTHVNFSNSVWSLDRMSVVSEIDNEVSLLRISADSVSASLEPIGTGTSPRWKVQDKVIEFKGEQGWEEVNVEGVASK